MASYNNDMIYRGVPRILVGGFLAVVKDTAHKVHSENLQNHAHALISENPTLDASYRKLVTCRGMVWGEPPSPGQTGIQE